MSKVYTKNEILYLEAELREARSSRPVYCMKCRTKLERVYPGQEGVSRALQIDLGSGYGEYVDTITLDEGRKNLSFHLCKDCANLFISFLGFTTIYEMCRSWHPGDDDEVLA